MCCDSLKKLKFELKVELKVESRQLEDNSVPKASLLRTLARLAQ